MRVTCEYCGIIFERKPSLVKRRKRHFCSPECSHKFIDKRKEVKCAKCGKYFFKSCSDILKSKNNFCSRSCSAKYYNKVDPKRQKQGVCLICGKIISKSKKICSSACYKVFRKQQVTEKVKKDITALNLKDTSVLSRFTFKDSYVFVKITGNHWIREHRYIMSKQLGRWVRESEVVHHKDGDRSNNNVENLELMTIQLHSRKHGQCKGKQMVVFKCPNCGKIYERVKRLTHLTRKANKYSCCSRKCSGILINKIKKGVISFEDVKANNVIREYRRYTRNGI